jgi:acyl-CoA thioester hydrolase
MTDNLQPASSKNPKEFNWKIRVYYEDTDAAGLVYHSNYLKYMERARTEWLRDLGYSQEQLKQELTLIFVLKSMNIRFHQPAKMDELLTVNARIEEIGGARLLFHQAVVNEQSNLVCDADVNVACLDANTLKPRRLPESIQKELRFVC